jgi:Holliday junction resolvasome RuvABC endonuclease subunit
MNKGFRLSDITACPTVFKGQTVKNMWDVKIAGRHFVVAKSQFGWHIHERTAQRLKQHAFGLVHASKHAVREMIIKQLGKKSTRQTADDRALLRDPHQPHGVRAGEGYYSFSKGPHR